MSLETAIRSSATLYVSENQLALEGEDPVHITPRETDVLALLARQPGEVVTRRELIERAWSGNHLVGEQGLSKTVHSLRSTLKDDPRRPKFIRTVPRRGYQLIGPVALQHPAEASEPARPVPGRHTAYAVAATLGVALLTIVFWSASRETVRAREVDFPYPLLNSSKAEVQPSLGGRASNRLLAVAEMADGGARSGWDIVVRSWPQLEHRYVFDSEADELGPALSPDGNRLAYFAHHQGACSVAVFDFRVMDHVWRFDCEPSPAMRIGWSPDSETFYLGTEQGIVRADLREMTTELVAASGSDRRLVKPEVLAGQRLAALEFPEDHPVAPRLAIFDLDTGERLESIELSGWASDFEFVADRLFIASGRPGEAGIWSLDHSGGQRRRLTDGPAFDLAVSGDGLVFARAEADIDLCLTDLSFETCSLDLSSSAAEVSPVFLGGGKRIAYLSNRLGSNHLHVFDLPAGQEIAVFDIDAETTLSGPYAASDASVLLAAGETVVFFQPDSGLSSRLTVPGLSQLLGIVDNRHLIFLDDQHRVMAMDSRSHERVVLASSAARAFLDQRERRLYVRSQDGGYAVHEISASDGEMPRARLLSTAPWPTGQPALGGDEVMFTARRFDRTDLLDARGDRLLSLPDQYSLFGLRFAIAGNVVVYEQIKLLNEDVFLLKFAG